MTEKKRSLFTGSNIEKKFIEEAAYKVFPQSPVLIPPIDRFLEIKPSFHVSCSNS
jgi:hypothetical protein